MSQPLISVIVPVYKTEAYLTKCLESIQSQTYPNLEIILVDDGSPDRSGELCDALQEKDARIKVVHKENGGLSSARNAGLDVMSGAYVGFVDSDDWIQPEMYARLMELMQRYDAQIAAGGMMMETGQQFNPHGDKDTEPVLFNRLEALQAVTLNEQITNSFCDKLFRADLFRTLRFPVGEFFEDFKTIHKCLELADQVVYTSQPMYIYRQTEQSISRGDFHPRMFEDAYAAKARSAYYLEKYPQIYDYAVASYIRVCLVRIWMSRNSAACATQRRGLIREMRGKLSAGAVRMLEKSYRVKLAALRISAPLYYGIILAHQLIKGK